MVKYTKRNGRKNKNHRKNLRKTVKRGGGILSAPVTIRNIKYIKTLENRLVNKWDDYEWVQKRREKNWMPKKPKTDYTDNNWTADDEKDNTKKEKGWFS